MAYDALSPEATGIPKKAEEGNTTEFSKNDTIQLRVSRIPTEATGASAMTADSADRSQKCDRKYEFYWIVGR
jgi:hypothetical protein